MGSTLSEWLLDNMMKVMFVSKRQHYIYTLYTISNSRPDDGGSKHIWNMGQCLPEYSLCSLACHGRFVPKKLNFATLAITLLVSMFFWWYMNVFLGLFVFTSKLTSLLATNRACFTLWKVSSSPDSIPVPLNLVALLNLWKQNGNHTYQMLCPSVTTHFVCMGFVRFSV
jgi:hypothetical protein